MEHRTERFRIYLLAFRDLCALKISRYYKISCSYVQSVVYSITLEQPIRLFWNVLHNSIWSISLLSSNMSLIGSELDDFHKLYATLLSLLKKILTHESSQSKISSSTGLVLRVETKKHCNLILQRNVLFELVQDGDHQCEYYSIRRR